MWNYVNGALSVFARYRYLLRNLIRRDFSVKYRRSVLGLAWSMLNPILMMLVLTAVFSYMFRFEIPYFPVYLLSGQLMFNFFSEGTNMGMESILMNSALVKKVYIPKYLFPLEKSIFSFINALLSLAALVVVILVTRVPLTPWLLLFPVPMLLLFVFILGVSLALSSLVIFFRDIKHLYSVFVLALTYMTPIFWPESMLPPGGFVLKIVHLNPMYWYVSMFRQVVLYGQAPTPTMWLLACGWAAGALLLGTLILKKTQDRFILHI